MIEVADLHSQLPDANIVVVDCRFNLKEPDAGRRAYEAGHIPGAVYAHLDADLAGNPDAHEGRHPLPRPKDFLATLGRLGIAAESFVVVYDDQGGAIAARLWWMLGWIGHERRAILNGGLIAWNAAGLPMESGAVSLAPLQYPDRVADYAQVATTEEIERHVETHDAAGGVRKSVLLDARAAARFRGEVEPIDPIAGHVPGALNLEFADLLDADGRFLSPDRLALRFSEVIGRGGASVAEDSIITMCGSGVTACHLLAGLAIAGRGGRLYVGSWSEWIRDSRRPVVRDN